MSAMTAAGPRALPPPEQRVVPIFEHIARAVGHELSTEMRVLDFGAGAGRHVGEFRDAGYDAWGVDQAFVSHEAGSAESQFLRRVEPPAYVLPFDRAEFDFVYSTSVMEHVLDPGGALSEIARVLRPSGLSIHVFPARWRPLEPHMYVPLGGRFQSYALMRLWAALGIRNGFQRGMPSRDVALSNVQYCKTGISYPTAREWEARASRLFSTVQWGEAHYIRASREVSGISRRLAPRAGVPGLKALYRTLHTRVLVLVR